MLTEDLENLKREICGEIDEIDFSNKKGLADIRVKVFGKAGCLTLLSKGMRDLSPEERPVVGALINEVRNFLEEKISSKEKDFEKQELRERLEKEKIDITEPSREKIGAAHPISNVLDRLTDICVSLGFSVVEGPEIETDYYNFEALNTPKNHPARDMQDTFFINDNILVRSQTSAVQAREMVVKLIEMIVIQRIVLYFINLRDLL